MGRSESNAEEGTKMKSTFGNQLKISLFGESHGPVVGVVLDGIPAGMKVDESFIQHQMDLRRAKGTLSTQRQEKDEVKIVSGVFQGMTTGTPICLCIENTNQKSKDYEKTKDLPRPSHADYTAEVKYLGYQDYRGGGHFSGRLTAPLVAAGALCLCLLKSKGIWIGSHILSVHGIEDDSFSNSEKELKNQIEDVNEKYFAVLNQESEKRMMTEIENIRTQCDSVGGIIETAVLGLPAGVGEPFFNSVESTLAHLLFSIGGVKGVEFGLGFEFEKQLGSNVNDAFFMDGDKIKTTTNNNGGINGGITNGMPVLFRCVIKPTPSIYKMQKTVNMKTKQNAELCIEGRHDPCIVHRARVVIDSVTAIGFVDLLLEQFGKSYFQGERK